MIQTLEISKIDLSLRIRSLDEETVEEYAESMQRGDEFPPVDIVFDSFSGVRYLIDGFHRCEATKRNGETIIAVNITDGTKQEALWSALGANRKNGMRLRFWDKRNVIIKAVEEFPDKSTRVLAAHIGCSQSYVVLIKKHHAEELGEEKNENQVNNYCSPEDHNCEEKTDCVKQEVENTQNTEITESQNVSTNNIPEHKPWEPRKPKTFDISNLDIDQIANGNIEFDEEFKQLRQESAEEQSRQAEEERKSNAEWDIEQWLENGHLDMTDEERRKAWVDDGCTVAYPAAVIEKISKRIQEENERWEQLEKEKKEHEALRLQQEKEKNAVPRVIGKDGRSYPATKKQPEHKPRKIEVPERSPLIPESIAGPYSCEAIQWLESLQNVMLAKPLDLTLRIHEGQLIVQSTNTEKPTLGTVPLERGTDWENWSFKPFFQFNETELEALESAGIKTIGQLSKVISTKWDERISVPKFGAKKLADLEEKFEKFWKDHPELCQ